MATPLEVSDITDDEEANYAETIEGFFPYYANINEVIPVRDGILTDGYVINRQSPVLYPLTVSRGVRR